MTSRTPKLKIYDTQPACPMATGAELKALLFPNGRAAHMQVKAFVAASAKASALAAFQAAGVSVWAPKHIRVGMGNDLNLLRLAGLPDVAGDVLIEELHGTIVVRYRAGEFTVAGEFEYDRKIHDKVFRRADGELFTLDRQGGDHA